MRPAATTGERKLTILSVAYPFARVGPEAVGGAEAVLTALEADLVKQGHRSLVLAQQGSTVAGTLLPVPAVAEPITDGVRQGTAAEVQRLLDHTLLREDVDLIHMHGIDFAQYRVPVEIPVLVTLHLPAAWYPESVWTLPRNYHLVCVSESQARSCPAQARERLRVLPNGVELPPRRPRAGKHGYALMLSRICPEKNLHTGLDAARLAGVPCVLGGEAFPYQAHLDYLRDEIEPRLSASARWPGPLVGERKRRWLTGARCVLIPSLAPETSSLLAMEALAAGTPVVAFPSGALPEIVEDGRTGFLVKSLEEMAAAIRRLARDPGCLAPERCREAARARFGFAAMAERYRAVYVQVANSRALLGSAR